MDATTFAFSGDAKQANDWEICENIEDMTVAALNKWTSKQVAVD